MDDQEFHHDYYLPFARGGWKTGLERKKPCPLMEHLENINFTLTVSML